MVDEAIQIDGPANKKDDGVESRCQCTFVYGDEEQTSPSYEENGERKGDGKKDAQWEKRHEVQDECYDEAMMCTV